MRTSGTQKRASLWPAILAWFGAGTVWSAIALAAVIMRMCGASSELGMLFLWPLMLGFGLIVALFGIPVTMAFADDGGRVSRRRIAMAIGIAAAAGFAVIAGALPFITASPGSCAI